jgi:hypothetical protein
VLVDRNVGDLLRPDAVLGQVGVPADRVDDDLALGSTGQKKDGMDQWQLLGTLGSGAAARTTPAAIA